MQVIHTQGYDSHNSKFVMDVTGGTSLATPMFSGVWALANEYYADKIVNQYGASLGVASVYGYWDQKYYPAAVKDISESSFSNREAYNVTGCEHRLFKKGCHPNYSPNYLIDATAPFISAIMAEEPNAPRNWYVLGFGTDSPLHTGAGWRSCDGSRCSQRNAIPNRDCEVLSSLNTNRVHEQHSVLPAQPQSGWAGGHGPLTSSVARTSIPGHEGCQTSITIDIDQAGL